MHSTIGVATRCIRGTPVFAGHPLPPMLKELRQTALGRTNPSDRATGRQERQESQGRTGRAVLK